MTIGTVDIRTTAIACQVRDDVGATRRTSAPIIVASPITVVVATRLLLVFLLVGLLHWQSFPRGAISSLRPWKLNHWALIPRAD